MFVMIEMTRELAPLFVGLNVILAVSGLAIVGAAVAPMLREWLSSRERPRVAVSRPALAGHSPR